MSNQSDPANAHDPAMPVVRPVGTWVVAGFLTAAVVTIWLLVAVIFQMRS